MSQERSAIGKVTTGEFSRRRLWGLLAANSVVGVTASALPSGVAQAEPATTQSFDKRLAAILKNPRTKSHRAVRRAMNKELAGQLPQLLGREAADPTSPLRVALAGAFQSAFVMSPLDARAGAGLLPPSTTLFSWDDFARSDRSLAGDAAPSGQTYRVTGNSANLTIRNRRHTPRPIPHFADVLLVDHPTSLSTVAARFAWTNGQSNRQNVVIGACPNNFGAGSIQLAVYADRNTASDPDWLLFCVRRHNGQIVYPTLASGQFVSGFTFLRNDATTYRMIMHRTAEDTVLIQLPDGQVLTTSHDLIREYWGRAAGVQLRRPTNSDGYGSFTAIATGI